MRLWRNLTDWPPLIPPKDPPTKQIPPDAGGRPLRLRLLFWIIIWANFPTKEELLSAQSASPLSEAQRVPELDLTIPGVTRQPVESQAETGGTGSATTLGGLSVPRDSRARQIVEVKCDADIQQYCPDSLTGDER